MLSELSVIWISLSVIVLCWAVVRINQKIDEAVSNYKQSNHLESGSETAGPTSRQSRVPSHPAD